MVGGPTPDHGHQGPGALLAPAPHHLALHPTQEPPSEQGEKHGCATTARNQGICFVIAAERPKTSKRASFDDLSTKSKWYPMRWQSEENLHGLLGNWNDRQMTMIVIPKPTA